MRLFGSLNNRLMEGAKQPEPEMGMGATLLMYSDRRAGTVVAVHRKGKMLKVVVQEDKVTRTDKNGMSDQQSYSYEPNLQGAARTYTRRKDGSWVAEGESLRGGTRLLLGTRDHYHDYSF